MKQQNSALIVTKPLPNTTSKEVTIYNANLTAKKFKSYETETDLLLLNAILLKWAMNLGIATPEPIELNRIANFIVENFSNFNNVDLDECVLLISLDKLGSEEIKHYGQLSIIYVSKALKAYQEHKSNVVFKVREQLQKQELENAPKISDAERVENFKNLLLYAKETVNKKEEYYDGGDVLYYFFWRNNLVERPMPEQFLKDAMAHGTATYKNLANRQALKDVINSVGFNKLEKESIIKKHARQYTTNEWLKKADVNSIVKKLSIEMINY